MKNYARKYFAGFIASTCLMSLLPVLAEGWGRDGHRIVGRIAAKHLSQKTQTAILNLLIADPDDRDHCRQQTSLDAKFACIATWADEVRNDNRFGKTAPLHFVDIPIYVAPAKRRYVASRDCVNGECVIQALEKYRRILVDQTKSASSRALALKFIVHFVGDMHQPLHDAFDHDKDAANKENNPKITDKGDRGGNLKIVTWLGQEANQFGCWNLHAVWDEGIIEKKNLSDEAYADALNSAIDPEKIPGIQKGTVIAWANEALGLAVNHSYKLPLRDTADKVCEVKAADKKVCTKFDAQACVGNEVHYRYRLDEAYNDSNLPVVELQLTKGGLRLAKFLNDIFDPAGVTGGYARATSGRTPGNRSH